MKDKDKGKVQTQTGQGQPNPPTRVELLETRVEQLELMVLELAENMNQLTETVAENMGVSALAQVLATVTGNGGKKGAAKFGGNTGPKKVKDTKTGITYDSLSKCAKAVAAEFGLEPDDHFAWYPIYKQDPDRFEILA